MIPPTDMLNTQKSPLPSSISRFLLPLFPKAPQKGWAAIKCIIQFYVTLLDRAEVNFQGADELLTSTVQICVAYLQIQVSVQSHGPLCEEAAQI